MPAYAVPLRLRRRGVQQDVVVSEFDDARVLEPQVGPRRQQSDGMRKLQAGGAAAACGVPGHDDVRARRRERLVHGDDVLDRSGSALDSLAQYRRVGLSTSHTLRNAGPTARLGVGAGPGRYGETPGAGDGTGRDLVLQPHPETSGRLVPARQSFDRCSRSRWRGTSVPRDRSG